MGTRLALKKNKSAKEIDSTNEYYNHFRGKSKSKGKLQAPLDEPSRVKYMNSIYMHKEHNTSTSQLETSNQKGIEKEDSHSNHGILSKFKMLEKHCGIDANGRILPKEIARHHPPCENSKNMDSQNTISMFDGEKKKDKKKGREKTRK